MKKKLLLCLVLCFISVFLLSPPVYAQEEQVAIPVSGTFDYSYEIIQSAETADYLMLDGAESEVWLGDIEGTAETIWRVGVYKNLPVEDVWLLSNFEGTVLGEYEGTMVILLVGDKPLLEEPTATQWYGEWAVVSGTGDLANVHGQGIWWGTGFSPDNGIPDIYYAGEITFMEAPEA